MSLLLTSYQLELTNTATSSSQGRLRNAVSILASMGPVKISAIRRKNWYQRGAAKWYNWDKDPEPRDSRDPTPSRTGRL